MLREILSLTLTEYFKRIGGAGDFHPRDAYEESSALSKISNELNAPVKGSVDECVKQFSRNGIRFKLIETTIDRALSEEFQFKSLSKEDKVRLLGKNRYHYEHRVELSDCGTVVARTQDEWGCLLYMVAPEYRGLGIGEVMLGRQLERHPFRDTGGFTPSGANGYSKQYSIMIRKAMADGYYSRAVRSGELSMAQAKQVLRSANAYNWFKNNPDMTNYPSIMQDKIRSLGLSDKDINRPHNYLNTQKSRYNDPSKINALDMSMSNPENLRLYVSDNTAVLYDKSVYELLSRSDGSIREQYFCEKAIKGYVHIGGVMTPDSPQRIFGMYAANKRIEALMHVVGLNMNVGEPLRIGWDQLHLIESIPSLDGIIKKGRYRNNYTITLGAKTMDVNAFALDEKKERLKFGDQYGELCSEIQSIAYGMAEERENALLHEPPAMSVEQVLEFERIPDSYVSYDSYSGDSSKKVVCENLNSQPMGFKKR